jgi:hypothetical protein
MISSTSQSKTDQALSDQAIVQAGLTHFSNSEGLSPLDSAESASAGEVGTRTGVRRLISFALVILALVFGLNALINFGLEHIKTSSFGAWNQAMQGRVNADILISGSSRATYHYDPRTIEATTGEKTFNIGRVGSQTDVQLAVLRAYLDHNKKPTIVIHNLDAFTFVMSREVYDPAQYVPYLSYAELYEPLHRIDRDMVKSRYLPLYGYIVEDMNFSWVEGLKALVGWMPKENYYLGFCPRDREWSDDFEKFKAGNPNGASFAIEPGGVKTLEELIQLCQKNGIQLILVYSPEYAGMQKMTNNRKQIFVQFNALANRYHVPLWDFSDWKHSADQAYFYNSQHLNANGAKIFSQDVADRLKDYIAQQHLAGDGSQAGRDSSRQASAGSN